MMPLSRRRFIGLGVAAAGVAACSGGSGAGSRIGEVVRGTAVPGQFRTVGADIIGPDGRPFRSLGANVVCRPWPVPEWWTGRAAANDKVDEALEWGWNTIRLHLSVNTDGTGLPRAAIFDGIMKIIDEYTRRQIVVIPVSFDHQAGDPTYDDLVASGVVDLQDALIAAHGKNPYLWLNPTDEQTPADSMANWASTGTAMHDRARSQGFDGVFVWDLPSYGQGLDLIAGSTLGSDFLRGKSNIAFGWHNFGAADAADQDAWAQQVIDAGIAVHIGGFGCGWDPSRPSVSDGWPTMDRDERRGADWVITRFARFGFGAVVWHGTGYVGGEQSPYSLRAGDNLPWYSYPAAPPLSPLGQRLYDLGQTLRPVAGA